MDLYDYRCIIGIVSNVQYFGKMQNEDLVNFDNYVGVFDNDY